MRNTILKIMMILFINLPVSLQGQIPEKSDTGGTNLDLHIGPLFELSRINKSTASFIGFKLSIKSEYDEIGLSLQTLNPTITDDNVTMNIRFKFDIFMGDIFYNKHFFINNKLFLIIGSSLGVGSSNLIYKENIWGEDWGPPGSFNELYASDTYYFLKPNAGFVYYILNNLSINIIAGYRIVSDFKMNWNNYPKLINYSNKDFNGSFINFSIKYIFILK